MDKKLKFYIFDNINYTLTILNIKEFFTINDLKQITSNLQLDNCFIFILYNQFGIIAELLLSNPKTPLYSLISNDKNLFAIGYSKYMQRCSMHEQLCNGKTLFIFIL